MSSKQFGMVNLRRQVRLGRVPHKYGFHVGDQDQPSDSTSDYHPESEAILDTRVVRPVEPVSPADVLDLNSEYDLLYGTGFHCSTHLSMEVANRRLLEAGFISGSYKIASLIHPTFQENTRDREHLLSMIDEVEQEANKPDWDGDGAVPLEAGTVAVARDLVGCFPSLKELPDISASPRGEIDFDWEIERRVSLTLCVCRPPRHDIVFLSTNGATEVRGRAPWDGELPQPVRYCFEMMKSYL